jgi:transcriptional regulator with XRE-family HTH domain
VEKKSPTPVDHHIGTRVRRRRMALGMSQEALGDALGLTFQQVQKYEKGTNRIGASRLLQISGILRVGIEFFFQGLEQIDSEQPAEKRSMAEFLAIADSERLVRSFVRLKDGEARRKVTDLVEWLATTGEDASGPPTKPYGRS